MRLDRLWLQDFRNVNEAELWPAEGVNILYGDNAQGKTNVLEAIWLFTGGKSFRGSKDSELVKLDAGSAYAAAEFFAEGREQQAEIRIEKRRAVTLNGNPQPAANRLTGHFCAVVFSPDHLSLIKEGPEGRRRFMDAAYCQLRPAYVKVLAGYLRALSQRNALLKSWRLNPDGDMLEVWDTRLAALGSQVIAARRQYLEWLSACAGPIYEGLSGGKEQLAIAYEPEKGYRGFSMEQLEQSLREQLCRQRPIDIEAGYTTKGPHREDLQVQISGLSARTFGSQGQQRSAVLALKLGEATVLRQQTGEQPVVLLDDVMSELDVARQDYIINHIEGWQVFITCCDPSSVGRLMNGRKFHVKQGQLTQEE